VNIIGRDGSYDIEAIPPECHGRAGYHGMLNHDVKRAAVPEPMLLCDVKREGGPEAEPQRMGIVINQISVAENGNDCTRPQEGLLDPPEFVPIPNIVLVRQDDDCIFAERDRFLKVLGRAEISVIDYNTGKEPRAASKLPYDFNASIRGTIITDYEFVWRPILGGDACQLLAEKPSTVKGAHCH